MARKISEKKMASRAFSCRSRPTWGPTISTRRMSASAPTADASAFFSAGVNSWALMSVASMRIRNSLSVAAPMFWTVAFSISMARRPSLILSMGVGWENFTWITDPPTKSIPNLGPP